MPTHDPYQWVDTSILDSQWLRLLASQLAKVNTADPYYTMSDLPPHGERDTIVKTEEGPLRATHFIRQCNACYVHVDDNRFTDNNEAAFTARNLRPLLRGFRNTEIMMLLRQHGVNLRAGAMWRFRKDGVIIYYQSDGGPYVPDFHY